jgi:parallel beta-helix repeat protein
MARTALVLLIALLACAAPAAAAPTTFTVNSPADPADPTPADGLCNVSDPETEQTVCTLRAAINASNANAGGDTIGFNLPPSSVIGLTAGLPTVVEPVTIDGYTEPDSAPNTNAGFAAVNSTITVAVDGNNNNTFLVTGGGTTIRGLRIYDSLGNGITLDGEGGNTVAGNVIGFSATPTESESNRGAGVAVYFGDDNVIGGTAAADRNVISDNGEIGNFNPDLQPHGIHVRGNADGTRVEGNLIGTTPSGTAALRNEMSGVRVGGFTTGSEPVNTAAPNTVIGGTAANAGNVISGNGGSFQGWGVSVGPAAGTGVTILGNRVGTDVTGTAALGNNPDGLETISDEPVQIGDDAGHGNLISGNVSRGISINSQGDTIQGNLIGTNAAGTAALGNGAQGIYSNGQTNTTIGGASAGARNVVSGNVQTGIELSNEASDNDILGNYIGTNAAGGAAIPNGRADTDPNDQIDDTIRAAGIIVSGGVFNTIRDNVISANLGPGVGLVPAEGPQATDNSLTSNLIGVGANGTTALGNEEQGVYIDGGSGNFIGGLTNGNTIANNGGDGIAVEDNQDEGFPTGNEFSANSIFSNAGLGIDLLPDGVTANDDDDQDSGPNLLQNFPVITSVTPGGSTAIAGTLNSTPEREFRIEFFDNAACDASGNGEGATYLGSTDVTTDAGGNASFNTTVTDTVAASHVVTATATPLDNVAQVVAGQLGSSATGTSEFSACLGPGGQQPEQPEQPEQPQQPQGPQQPQEPEPEPQEPEEPNEPNPRPRCKDRTPPVSVLRRSDVDGRGRKLRLLGPTGIKIKGRSHDVRPCRTGIARVLVSLARVNGRHGVNCRYIKDPNRYDLRAPGNCNIPILFRVNGRKRWSFKFGAPLKPGDYRIRVRAFDRAGNKEEPTRRNGVVFKVR